MPADVTAIAARLAAMPDFSWRASPLVPDFPDTAPLIVFDGVCVLCSGFARFVARHDTAAQFRFTAAQSPLGQAMYRHFGLDPVNYETNLLIADGRAFAKLAAFTGIMRRLGRPWSMAAVADRLPASASDTLYDWIARNRYRAFGRRETCILPDATWRQRMID